MAQIFINTIVGTADNLSQIDFIQKLNELALEIDGIEVRGEMFSAEAAKREDEIKEITHIAQKNDWDLMISHPIDLFDPAGITKEAKEILQQADRHGFKNVKFNMGNPEGISKVAVDTIQEMFASINAKVSIENGQNETNGTLRYVKYALDNSRKQKLPLGFTYDMGNWAIMGEDPKEAHHALKDAITLFHLKNVNHNGETTLLDDGIISWRALVDLDIPYIIEYAIPFDELPKEVHKLKEVISE